MPHKHNFYTLFFNWKPHFPKTIHFFQLSTQTKHQIVRSISILQFGQYLLLSEDVVLFGVLLAGLQFYLPPPVLR